MLVLFFQSIIRCDEDEAHVASVYCTVCATHLCADCSQLTHSTKTLAKHKRVPLADKPHEKTMCSQHQVHAIEVVCLEEDCQASPLMCCVCKEYGKHQGHKVLLRICFQSYYGMTRILFIQLKHKKLSTKESRILMCLCRSTVMIFFPFFIWRTARIKVTRKTVTVKTTLSYL